MKKLNNEKGFTLLEMTMAAALSTIIASSLFLTMRQSDANLQTSELNMTVKDSAREGLYKMIQELRQSSPGNTTIAADCSTITFRIPNSGSPLDADYSVNWTSSTQIRYAKGGTNNTQVIRTNLSTNATTVVANDLSTTLATPLLFTTDTATHACTAGTNPNVIAIVMNVQRTLLNNRVVPATPFQMVAHAEIRNNNN